METLQSVFESLTIKQRETIELLADGRTSKEIAAKLDISESAVIQRIETLRSKFGGVLRKDLARLWREHRATQPYPYNHVTGNNFQLPPGPESRDNPQRTMAGADLFLADAYSFETHQPWSRLDQPKVVPEVLDSENATLYRWVAAALLAIAMVTLLVVLLAVAGQLNEML